MPKLKTHRGAAKRFRSTGKGKFKRSSAFANHIMTKKTRKKKRGLRKSSLVHETDIQRVKDMLPYAG